MTFIQKCRVIDIFVLIRMQYVVSFVFHCVKIEHRDSSGQIQSQIQSMPSLFESLIIPYFAI